MADAAENEVVKRYADAAEKIYPSDPIGFCERMAEEQRRVWTLAREELMKRKPNSDSYDCCSECGGQLQQAGSCKVCTQCGSTTGCG